MSTGSIKHNIEIANPADAERFVEALEEAERISEEGMERLTAYLRSSKQPTRIN
jgi:transcriptional regulator of NAD metabolism